MNLFINKFHMWKYIIHKIHITSIKLQKCFRSEHTVLLYPTLQAKQFYYMISHWLHKVLFLKFAVQLFYCVGDVGQRSQIQ